ncbi:MAG: DUF1552 domain-containing protein [Planctomycetes bacterium]|nr:DUF1552 domain-containing protein [Planctomycetota bacterium]
MNPLPPSRPSRRQFLRASAVLLALPWLESLGIGGHPAVAGEPAAPGKAGPPRRLVAICAGFGLYGKSFFPAKAGRDYEDSEYTKVISGLRDRFTVFSGISHPEIGGDHASEACFLTSAKHPTANTFRNTVSLDYVAARQVGNATRFPLLTLRTSEGGSALTYTATGASVSPMDRPSQIFARMFLAGQANEVAAEMERLRRGQSVLDRMGDRFAALRTRLSAHDQQQITDYTDAVRDMEKQLHADEAWAVRPKPTVTEPPPSDNTPQNDSIGRARVLFGLTRLALQTDATRVVSIFIRGMDLRPPIAGVKDDHHGVSHHGQNPDKIEQLRLIERTEMAAFGDFLSALQATKEGAGSLLDTTQVLIGSNLGDASGHGTSNLPILLAGGGWRHGQHLAGDADNNTPLCNLFVSMLQRFGVETATFGSSTGPLTGLT